MATLEQWASRGGYVRDSNDWLHAMGKILCYGVRFRENVIEVVYPSGCCYRTFRALGTSSIFQTLAKY